MESHRTREKFVAEVLASLVLFVALAGVAISLIVLPDHKHFGVFHGTNPYVAHGHTYLTTPAPPSGSVSPGQTFVGPTTIATVGHSSNVVRPAGDESESRPHPGQSTPTPPSSTAPTTAPTAPGVPVPTRSPLVAVTVPLVPLPTVSVGGLLGLPPLLTLQ